MYRGLTDNAGKRITAAVLDSEAQRRSRGGDAAIWPVPQGPPIARFELLETLAPGGSASAVIVEFLSGSYTPNADLPITVYDTLGLRRGGAAGGLMAAGSAGWARYCPDSQRWEILTMQPMALMLWAKVDESSTGFVDPDADSFHVKECHVAQPIGGLLNAYPTEVQHPFSVRLEDGDAVLVLWDENDAGTSMPWVGVSVGPGSGRRAMGTAGTFASDDDPVSVSDFISLGGGDVPAEATNCKNPGFAGVNPVTVFLDWRPDLNAGAGGWIITGVVPVKLTIVTAIRWDATSKKYQYKTRDVMSQWGGDESDWTDIGDALVAQTVLTAHQVDGANKKLQYKTRSVIVQSGGDESGWTDEHTGESCP